MGTFSVITDPGVTKNLCLKKNLYTLNFLYMVYSCISFLFLYWFFVPGTHVMLLQEWTRPVTRWGTRSQGTADTTYATDTADNDNTTGPADTADTDNTTDSADATDTADITKLLTFLILTIGLTIRL